MELNLSRIPHIYHDTKYVRKLFEIIKEKHKNICSMWQEISLFYDIEKASGHMLDILGGNFKISRNGRTDVEYRKIIAFEITTLQFMGSPEEIKRIISTYFEESSEQIFIREFSGKVYITVPDAINIELLKKLVKRIKTAGVGYNIDYEIYIEDYLLSELEEKTLEEIERIKLSRR